MKKKLTGILLLLLFIALPLQGQALGKFFLGRMQIKRFIRQVQQSL